MPRSANGAVLLHQAVAFPRGIKQSSGIETVEEV